MIEVVTQYKCPVTGLLWSTEKQAKNCATRARARAKKKLAEEEEAKKLAEEMEFRRNFVRLNAKSPSHAFELLLSKSEEFWGIKFELEEELHWFMTKNEVGLASTSHLVIKAKVTDTKIFTRYYQVVKYCIPSISDFLEFIGFVTGSGTPGNFNSSRFKMSVYIPFENFPTIDTNFKLVKSDRDKLSQRHNHRNEVFRMARVTALEQPECQEMQDILNNLNNLRGDLGDKVESYVRIFVDRYVTEFWDKVNPVPSVNSELQEMFSNVH